MPFNLCFPNSVFSLVVLLFLSRGYQKFDFARAHYKAILKHN